MNMKSSITEKMVSIVEKNLSTKTRSLRMTWAWNVGEKEILVEYVDDARDEMVSFTALVDGDVITGVRNVKLDGETVFSLGEIRNLIEAVDSRQKKGE